MENNLPPESKVRHPGKILKYSLFLLLAALALALIYFYLFLTPNNYRSWEFGFEALPKVAINGDKVTINDLRNYSFANNIVTPNYLSRTVDVTKLQRAWFVVEPFTIKPFTFFKGVAHTYFVFDFEGEEPIVVSVEARREKGEKYDAWKGMFNQYELIYVWGTEKDETVRRVIAENNQLYMYPLTITPETAQKLFLVVAKTTQDLETNPRFYNTFLSNCTNELAKAGGEVKPDSVPWSPAYFFPGFSAEELYKLGYIPHQEPFEKIKQKYYISDLVRQLNTQPNFSKQLRQNLL